MVESAEVRSRGLGIFLFLTACAPAQRLAPTFPGVQSFLDVCPQNDPYYAVFRRDFQILRDRTAVGEIPCVEPYTKSPLAQITEELSILQALRFAYYMDMGQSQHLPWTPLRLYDWFKSRVAGFNIDSTLDGNTFAASCCFTISGRLYITIGRMSDATRMSRLNMIGLLGQVALFAHETRHSEGSGYVHVSCCGVNGGCDQSYDEQNLSAYGVQYYLYKQWLTGGINLGYSCDTSALKQTADSLLGTANIYPRIFCDQKPPVLSTPPSPGGACIPACTLAVSRMPDASSAAAGAATAFGISSSTAACGWTADSAESWITATAGVNFAGTAAAAFAVAPNQSAGTRTANLIAGGFKMPITQPPCAPSCTATVSIAAVTGGAPGVNEISGGSWVTIYGSNLASTSRQWSTADFSGTRLPASLDGVSVRIDGLPAAVYYVSAGQLNVQAPDDGASGPVEVRVTNSLGTATATVALRTYAPSWFLLDASHIAAVHADGTIVGPARPARPGEIVSLFGTGFGPTTPTTGSGVLLSSAATLANPAQLQLRIGGQSAAVQFAGLVGPGLYQVNVTIPAVADGDQPVTAAIGGAATPAGRAIAVQR
jgi:uncharacterized protein (TIGR03437 family)